MFDTFMSAITSTTALKTFGALVLAGLCFGVMRMRRHSVMEAACFAGGVLGMIIVLTLIKSLLF